MVSWSVILYALTSRQGVKINTLSPQGVIMVLCAMGSLLCVLTCLAAPSMIRMLGYAIRPEAQIRRMSLLGLVGWLAYIQWGHRAALATSRLCTTLHLTSHASALCFHWQSAVHYSINRTCEGKLWNVELLSARVPLLMTKCGLQPDDVVQDLASSKTSAADIGWLRYFWDHFLHHDIFAVVNKSDRLIQIHSTAEQFDPIAENLFRQIPVSCNNFQ